MPRKMNEKMKKEMARLHTNLNQRSNPGAPAWFPLVTETHVVGGLACLGPHVHRGGHGIPVWIPEGVGEQPGQSVLTFAGGNWGDYLQELLTEEGRGGRVQTVVSEICKKKRVTLFNQEHHEYLL